MKNPKVSVIMPVYNSEKYLDKALESILSQSFKDYELIIIDDGSNDGTNEIISRIKDKRTKVITNKKNLGVAKSLNIGLKRAKGEYTARCDSDDINDKDRFKIQVNFLDKNKDYVLVGSSFEIIDEKGRKIGETMLPETDEEIKRKILIRNPILHPSVIYRRKVALKVGGYREFLNGVEDYDLFFRLLRSGKLHNLREKLVKRRWHKNVVTRKSHIKVELLALLVRLLNLGYVTNGF